ncbi:Rieske (2Fe-2S) protein [Streptomyces sp. SCA3-4]|uniref:Rieske (2Fe-2S) protein n=1 Tax=Streptomyces sichuanensis TaxID=2871810 RepID=UPI001CE3404A|nr:Rieske (2Fe-2S) protein [Streptomyces sichuanensis]MCA6092691.1 Rieske (2Fe-2S) protein [Streptomyces sichuanensis]
MTHPSPVSSSASCPAPAGTTRRTVVATAGAAGLAAVLAACGGSDGKKSPDTSQPAPRTEGASGGSSGTTSEATGKPGKGEALATTAEIPVGGGKVFADRKVVVTQPTKGEFKAFSAVCTHQGCLVTEVANGTIDCPCHGSRFSVADGSVRTGPARKPLPPERVSVSGNSLTVE